MAGPDSVELEPVADNGIRAVQVGLGLWVVAGAVLLFQRESLADRDAQWWLLACGAGLVIGLIEWAMFARHASRERARASTRDAA